MKYSQVAMPADAMRVLILGAYGMLGHKLFLELGKRFETYATCREIRKGDRWSALFPKERLVPGVQVERMDSVDDAVKRTKPDAVINCIGIVKQLDAAKDLARSLEVNSLFPHRLSVICRARDARLVHFSTDCVFSGRKGKYKPTDTPDADDVYGRTKYLGELEGDGCVTIRSSIIGRELGTSNGLIEWFIGQKGKAVSGYRKAVYSGFTTLEMANIVSKVLVEHEDMKGVWHVASKRISKYDLLDIVNRKMGLGIEIRPDDKFQCDRSLDGSEFNRLTGYSPPSWDEMIGKMVEDKAAYG